MMHRHNRSNAVLDQPVYLRYVLRNASGNLADPLQLGRARVSTVDFTSKEFQARKHVLQTCYPERMQRICKGVYEVVLPAGVCRRLQEYFDVYESSDPDIPTVCNSFVMQDKAPAWVGYCNTQQVRCQDSPLEDEESYSDAVVNEAIAAASQLMDRWTDRWFVPIRQTFFLSGSGSRMLALPQPLLHLEGLQPLFGGDTAPWVTSACARSCTAGSTQTLAAFACDQARDWDNPCLIVGMRLPTGQRNIVVHGLFGTTDEEGNPPAAVVRATARLAARNLLNNTCNGPPPGPLVSETTDGHSYQLALSGAAQNACFSGDPDIDMVVRSFQRPVAAGNILAV
ncbi:MAG: hypothetical protein AAF310_05995 [Myxococcota bacterium]